MNKHFRSLKPIAPAFVVGAMLTAALAFVPSAYAEDAAGKIADKFAGSDSAAPRGEKTDEERIRAEARKAVEQALAKEAEGTAPAAKAEAASDQPAANAEGKSSVADAGGAEPKPAPAAPMKPAAPAGAEPEQPAASHSPNEEAEALSEQLKAVRREHEIETLHPHPAEAQEPKEEPGIVAEVVSKFAAKAAGYISPLVEKHVTIMLVMDVGKTGVRRWSKTADPMLCIHENCYISRGPDKPAEKLSREKAFGPSVALGERGGACRSKPACIFRDIDLETVEAKLQPIDLKFLHHDRREAMPIRADTTCAIIEGQLSCRSPVEGKSWKAWIVPESVAKRAGGKGLEQALKRGID